MAGKLNRKRFWMYVLLNTLILCGVIAISFRKPAFIKVNNAKLVSTTDSFFNFRISLAVQNSNFFSISGKDLDIKLSETEREFGKGNIEPFCLKKASKSDIEVTVKMNYMQVIRAYNAQASDTLIPSVVITGSFMPGFFIHKINLDKKVPRSDIFKMLTSAFNGSDAIRADSFSIKKVNPLETQISFAILFTNSVDITFSIREVNATIYTSEKSTLSLGKASLSNIITLKAKEKAAVPMQLAADNVSIVRALLQSGLKSFDSFFAKGDMVIEINGEQMRIPFSLPFGNQNH